MKISMEDRIYAAGFLDGEGCFTIGRNWKPVIAVENTYRPVIEWLHKTFGGSLTVCKGRKKNHRTTYRWAVVCKKAVGVCQVITPFLKEKSEQSLLLLAIHQTCQQGRKISLELAEERNRLTQRVKMLKGRL